MNISRNVFLAALVAFALPVFAEDSAANAGVAQREQQEASKATEAKTEEAPKKEEESKGFFAKAGALVASPFVFTANGVVSVVDWTAANGGAQRLANWLGKTKDAEGKDLQVSAITSFFNKHAYAVQTTLALTEVAVVVAAAYKAYEAFVAEEDNNEDEYDFEAVEFDNE